MKHFILYFMIIMLQSIIDTTSLFGCFRVRIGTNVANTNNKHVYIELLAVCLMPVLSMMSILFILFIFTCARCVRACVHAYPSTSIHTFYVLCIVIFACSLGHPLYDTRELVAPLYQCCM